MAAQAMAMAAQAIPCHRWEESRALAQSREDREQLHRVQPRVDWLRQRLQVPVPLKRVPLKRVPHLLLCLLFRFSSSLSLSVVPFLP